LGGGKKVQGKTSSLEEDRGGKKTLLWGNRNRTGEDDSLVVSGISLIAKGTKPFLSIVRGGRGKVPVTERPIKDEDQSIVLHATRCRVHRGKNTEEGLEGFERIGRPLRGQEANQSSKF